MLLSAQFNLFELFIAGIFHLIFLDCGWPRYAPETMESEVVDKVGTTVYKTVSSLFPAVFKQIPDGPDFKGVLANYYCA